jgi:hypothetical protein
MEARQVSRKFASDGRTSMGIDGEDKTREAVRCRYVPLVSNVKHRGGTPSKGTRASEREPRSIYRRSLSEKERASAGL